MSKFMDDKLGKSLKSKFEGFEAPVADDLWAGVKAGLPKPRNSSALLGKRWMLLLIPLLFLLSYLGSQYVMESGPEQNELPLTSEDKVVDEQEISSIAPDTSRVRTKPLPIADALDGGHDNGNFSNSLSEPLNESQQTPMVALWVVELPQIETQELDSQISNEISPLEVPAYSVDLVFEEFSSPMLIKTADITDSLTEEKKKSVLHFTFGLNSSYLNIRPNLMDDVYFKDITPAFDIATDHWGLSLGVILELPLSENLNLRNEGSIYVRQHDVSLEYITNASNSENVKFEKIVTTFIPVSLNISTGLIYKLPALGNRKKSLDINIGYEKVIHNSLQGKGLVNYPKGLWNVSLGFSVHPKKVARWIVRPFGYYGLNRKYSEAPLQLTPYGFGVQFNK